MKLGPERGAALLTREPNLQLFKDEGTSALHRKRPGWPSPAYWGRVSRKGPRGVQADDAGPRAVQAPGFIWKQQRLREHPWVGGAG